MLTNLAEILRLVLRRRRMIERDDISEVFVRLHERRQDPCAGVDVSARMILKEIPRDAELGERRQPAAIDLHGTEVRRSILVARFCADPSSFRVEDQEDDDARHLEIVGRLADAIADVVDRIRGGYGGR